MNSNDSLQNSLRALIQVLLSNDGTTDEAERIMKQIILPSLAAKLLLDNIGEALDSINSSNEDLLGFQLNEVDFYKALYRLIPNKIKELENEDALSANTLFNTPDLS